MGKSPAKWMKKLLHRKKSSKSDHSKNAMEEKSSSTSHESSKVLSSNPAISGLASSNPITGGNPEVEREKNVNLRTDGSASSVASSRSFDLSDKAEFQKLEVSATILQAALRASMARQAYRSLKGIVRLQALIRGHLVRRQAAATLHCVKGIVKLQAVVRGRMIRLSDVGIEFNKKFLGRTVQDANAIHCFTPNSSTVLEKLPPNVFAGKILASQISTSPLHFQYDPTEPNSLSMWLERWSSSHFWGSVAKQKKVSDSAAGSRKRRSTQTIGAERGSPPNRDVRRESIANNVEKSCQYMSSEHGKPKRYSRKPIPSQQGEATPENELERVKRNLRKIALNSKETSQGKNGPSSETMKQRNVSLAAQSQVLGDDNYNNYKKGNAEPGTGLSSQPISDESESKSFFASGVKEHGLIKSASSPDDMKPPSGVKIQKADTLLIVHESSDLSHNSLSTEQYSEENGVPNGDQSITSVNENSGGREKRMSRRKSLPSSKQEQQLEKKSKQLNLPSYMAATESAKRKLRGLGGTPRFAGVEGEEEDNSTSRQYYSLSTSGSGGGKLSSSVSPRILKISHASSEKDGLRGGDRSLTSSRDSHGKVTRPGWRR